MMNHKKGIETTHRGFMKRGVKMLKSKIIKLIFISLMKNFFDQIEF